jgi:hypothetical protein
MLKSILAAPAATEVLACDWHPTIAKQEAALATFHASFSARSRAVAAYVDELIASGRLRNAPPPRSEILNDGETYELDNYPGQTFRNGLLDPGE